MLDTIFTMYSQILSNPVFAGLISIYGIGIATFLLRNVPSKIFYFIERYCSTSITLTSYNDSFHNAIKFFNKEFVNKNYRTIKISNGKWGGSRNVKSLGYGHHWCFLLNRPIKIELIKDSDNKTENDKDVLEIRIWLTWNHKKLNELTKNFEEDFEPKQDVIDIYGFEGEYWEFAKNIPQRTLDSVFLNSQIKQSLSNRLDSFIQSEEFYKTNKIPYQLGILLYGSPGTGKTTLAKAIAAYVNYPLYVLQLKDILKIDKAIMYLQNEAVLLIEDIDTVKLSNIRHDEDDDEKQLMPSIGSLSDILNAIDGVFTTEGRILVMTTNFKEKLDSALLRPGRIDLALEIPYIDMDAFISFVNKYFPQKAIPNDLKLKQFSGAYLQELLLRRLSFEEILEEVADKN